MLIEAGATGLLEEPLIVQSIWISIGLLTVFARTELRRDAIGLVIHLVIVLVVCWVVHQVRRLLHDVTREDVFDFVTEEAHEALIAA